MNRLPTFLLIALSICTGSALAQDSSGGAAAPFEIPSGQLLHSAPAFSQWTTQFSYPEDKKKDGTNPSTGTTTPLPSNLANRPRTIITTKTRDVIHEETTTVGGSQTDAWQVKGDCYVKFPGRTLWTGYEASNPAEIVGKLRATLLMPANGFRDLAWISRDAYAGRMKSEWGDCFVFLPGGHDAVKGNFSQEKLDTFPTVAYIDAETRLPVMVRTPDSTRLFKFTQPPPDSMQTLPDVLANEIKANNAMQAQRNAAPSREY